MALTGWAASCADGLLAPLGDRWAHVQGVVRQAQEIAVIPSPEQREVLIASCYHLGGASRAASARSSPSRSHLRVMALPLSPS